MRSRTSLNRANSDQARVPREHRFAGRRPQRLVLRRPAHDVPFGRHAVLARSRAEHGDADRIRRALLAIAALREQGQRTPPPSATRFSSARPVPAGRDSPASPTTVRRSRTARASQRQSLPSTPIAAISFGTSRRMSTVQLIKANLNCQWTRAALSLYRHRNHFNHGGPARPGKRRHLQGRGRRGTRRIEIYTANFTEQSARRHATKIVGCLG